MANALTQKGRPMRAQTAIGEDALLLVKFDGTEQISSPYRFTLELMAEDPAVAVNKVLRQPLAVTIDLPDGEQRVLHGIVSRFVQGGTDDDGLTSYQAEIVPWLWLLSLSSDCRVFQNLSVLDIVQQVFRDHGFKDFDVRCVGTYAPREYCVQYRETHLDFVSRLLEDEGIFYFFEHTNDKHTLVLADSTSAIKPCVGAAKARFERGATGANDGDVVTSVIRESRVDTGKVTLVDYNYLQPSAQLRSTVSGPQPDEWYDYPGNFAAPADGDRYARIRLEEREVTYQIVSGKSACFGFTAGGKFDLSGAPRRDINTSYQLLQVAHHGNNGAYRGAQAPFAYSNEFVAIPFSVPYRPPRVTSKPIMRGSQTAMVVGKKGEEIWTDKFGRVKVQFYWDRVGTRDERSSCWVRVSAMWAGKGWGQLSVPRIGQEVVVDFLEGDPDRPIITGSVYNAEQAPPNDPGSKGGVVSGLRSNTHKGSGYNEISMDDTAGSEKVTVHADYDLVETIGHDMVQSIGNDRTTTVGKDRVTTVSSNDSETVGENQSVTVGKDLVLTVGGLRTSTIGKDDTTNIGGGRTENIGKDSILSIAGAESITIGKTRTVSVGGDDVESVSGAQTISVSKAITLSSSTSLTISVGDSQIVIKPTEISISATQISIKASGQVTVKGGTVNVN